MSQRVIRKVPIKCHVLLERPFFATEQIGHQFQSHLGTIQSDTFGHF